MFFPERVVSIGPHDRVLEVGPGGAPHPRADVLLERKFDDEDTARAQRGFRGPADSRDRKQVYYDGGQFPFADDEFDYVICSHVLEHIPADELACFVGELQRVASRGYLEFPNVFYELINYQPVHLWFMHVRDGEMLFLDKSVFRTNPVHEIYRQMFYAPDGYCFKCFQRYKELFVSGFEWSGKIMYRIVDDFDALINDEDVLRMKNYLSGKLEQKDPCWYDNIPGMWRFVRMARGVRAVCGLAAATLRTGMINGVHRTARLQPAENIEIGEGVQIQEYVIVRAHNSRVTIGANTMINPYVVIYGGSGISIGENVMIGPHCMLAAGNHNYRQMESPMRCAGSISAGPIVVEADVWIAANVTITDGVRIGCGAVVGAGSVVTKDVEPFSVVGGIPASVIGWRNT